MADITRWEYKVVTVPSFEAGVDFRAWTSSLNRLGDKGWEAVGAFSYLYQAAATTTYHEVSALMLKRPKADAN
jgi:hypothetical protein